MMERDLPSQSTKTCRSAKPKKTYQIQEIGESDILKFLSRMVRITVRTCQKIIVGLSHKNGPALSATTRLIWIAATARQVR